MADEITWQFNLNIMCENDEFSPDPKTAIARILREVANNLESGRDSYRQYRTLHDINGNDVGRAALKPAGEFR
jgi:hypothetical protein